MAKLVRHLTSNEEIVSSTLAEGIFFNSKSQLIFLHNCYKVEIHVPFTGNAKVVANQQTQNQR